jgi:hypothetical protein
VIAGAIGLWGLRVEAKLHALQKRNAEQDQAHERLRSFLDDVVIGHVDEARLRRELSYLYGPDADRRRLTR